jgi:ABC-type dipeptide/oligopeptide/nickel transport system ATPase component
MFTHSSPILKNISFKIGAGKTSAIVGQSGSGNFIYAGNLFSTLFLQEKLRFHGFYVAFTIAILVQFILMGKIFQNSLNVLFESKLELCRRFT